MENKVFAVILAEPVADVISVITTIIVFSVQFAKTLKSMETPQERQQV